MATPGGYNGHPLYSSLQELSLTAGNTYYFYGLTNNDNYSAVPLLWEFTFVPEAKFVFASDYSDAQSGRTTNGATSYSDVILYGTNTSGATFTTECYGNVASATTDGTGKITSITYTGDDHGGAVVVNALLNGNVIDTYVLTIPYNNGIWTFTAPDVTDALERTCSEIGGANGRGITIESLNNNNTNWTSWWKVRSYVNRVLSYLNGPVYANSVPVFGDNANYISASAGLIIDAPAKNFGVNAGYNDANLSLVDKLNISNDKLTSVSHLTLKKGAVLTIPNLKQGQFVKSTGTGILMEKLKMASGIRMVSTLS